MDWGILTILKTAKIGPKLWILLEPMIYTTPNGLYIVPAGYLTDHASVPRVFTSVVPPVQSCIAEASILHDWLYNKDSRSVTREFADLCLRELTIIKGGSKFLSYTAWLSVRAGGMPFFKKEYAYTKIKKSAYPEYLTCTEAELNMIFKIGKYKE